MLVERGGAEISDEVYETWIETRHFLHRGSYQVCTYKSKKKNIDHKIKEKNLSNFCCFSAGQLYLKFQLTSSYKLTTPSTIYTR